MFRFDKLGRLVSSCTTCKAIPLVGELGIPAAATLSVTGALPKALISFLIAATLGMHGLSLTPDEVTGHVCVIESISRKISLCPDVGQTVALVVELSVVVHALLNLSVKQRL
jgi:hypothetical protein